ncbi:hypothetical protein AAT17_00405 [Nonlabens sp. MIC269]|uniref:hypothetical protein n=1 Tax=Nonlabens sp. MIC269 TaxID=1476901 RepID=UPI000721C482|nr:hypothetical protein [Nonlabens sp. MIC269]ALM19826.1 hypothetical protein AAT17_00405 [Nonlabens sp. MIC269]
MREFKDWKEFINRILINSGQFEKPVIEFKGEVEIETYKLTDKNSLTEIRVGYFLQENKLIYLHIFNPTVPGYNKYVEDEYFYYYDFDDKNSYGDPALEFNKRNVNGVFSILKNGLKGKEIQFVKNDRILKSILYIHGVNPKFNFSFSYDFTNRGFWNKIFGQKIDKMNGVEKREIELNSIFNGI